ncbi:hypothetical protein CFAEC_13180 [Corynebacterium faecale]|uniref:hypothetical protein n=1 Tax=Corynebacterium faecale TaxID=1758466 RepID=UPI0025B5527B|nr:hypothetical protein [Corynebacterium faecale]WJY93421.1 hypothetical protein CFAEC_13180 [Corynebacterium faecale]
MSNLVDGGEFTTEIDEKTTRWSSLLAKATWAVLALGVVVGGILWVAIDGVLGEDLGALAWVMTFSASIALMSIRQMLLAERN